MGDVLLLAFIFLVAGVIAVPIASRLGLGSVLGYLIAGIALSPLLRELGIDVIAIQGFAEFGVVMMLFLVGIELEPKRLWEMRGQLLGLGGLQVALTVLAIMGVAMAFGQPWSVSLAIGMVFTLSSTAIVLQTLNEKGLMRSDGGDASFAVLLAQDIAVIPMLAFIPMLALPELADAAMAQEMPEDQTGSMSLVEGLGPIPRVLVTLGAIGAVILGGIYLSRPIFRFIATAQLRELFTAAALLIVVGIALLMTVVGLSPALGAFLAGVVLANSEYRHELESDIDPFRGLLLGLFFITVGASVDFQLLGEKFFVILGLTIGLLVLKTAVMLALSLIFKVTGPHKWLFAMGLSQAGEFGFVLLALTTANNVIPQPIADQLLLIVTLSMLLTPPLFILFEKVIAPRFNSQQEKEADQIDQSSNIIIAGHGRFGGIVSRMLGVAGYTPTVLDYSSDTLEMLRTFGRKVFFGDATRPDLLNAAGIKDAKLFIVAIDGKDQITALVRYVTKAYPHVHVIARAVDRNHVYDLYAAGCRDIIRETFDSGVRVGRSAFEALGMHPFEAERMAQQFVKDDKRALVELAAVYDPTIPNHQNSAYVAKAKEVMDVLGIDLDRGSPAFTQRTDRGWSPPTVEDVSAEEEKAKE